jgi:hypothetical protein
MRKVSGDLDYVIREIGTRRGIPRIAENRSLWDDKCDRW